MLVGSSGVGPLLRAAVVGGRWLGVFSGVSGKGGGGFFAWALKDFPALPCANSRCLRLHEGGFRHGDFLSG